MDLAEESKVQFLVASVCRNVTLSRLARARDFTKCGIDCGTNCSKKTIISI